MYQSFDSSNGKPTLDRVHSINYEPSEQHTRRRPSKEPSLVLALSKSFGGIVMMAAVFKLFSDILSFVSPQVLK